jgi:hypothetical protein
VARPISGGNDDPRRQYTGPVLKKEAVPITVGGSPDVRLVEEDNEPPVPPRHDATLYRYTYAEGIGGYVVEQLPSERYVGVVSGNKPTPDAAVADYRRVHGLHGRAVRAVVQEGKASQKAEVVVYKVSLEG